MTLERRYTQYRATDAKTFKEVPDHWDVIRVRHLAAIRTGTGDTVDAVADGEYPFYVRSAAPLRSATWGFDTTAVLTAGDGAGVGKVFHLASGQFLAHQRVYVIDGFRQVKPRFFFYQFSSQFHLMALDGSAKSTVDSVRRQMIADMPIAVPPHDEQQAIVDYLDRETAQIDTLIAKQEQLIATLRERTSSLRSSLLAEDGERRRTVVRRALEKLNRVPLTGQGVITAYRDGVVTLRSNRREGGYTFSDTEAGYQGIEPGDVVFHALDGFAGAVGVSDSRGVGSPVYHVCRPRGGVDPNYVAELLRFLGTSGFLTQQAPNVRERSIDFRNWQTFARVPLELPDLERQKAVVRKLAEHDRLTASLSAKAERFIELAKERRAALITAAVTGQIDVRAA